MWKKLQTWVGRRMGLLLAGLCLFLLLVTVILPALRNLSQQAPCATVEWEGELVPCPIQLTEQVSPFFGGIRFTSKINDPSVQWVNLYLLKDGVPQNTERKKLRVYDAGFQMFRYRLFPDEPEARYQLYAETDGNNGYIYQYCVCDVVFTEGAEPYQFQRRPELSVFDSSGTYRYTIQRPGPETGSIYPHSIVYAPSGKLLRTNVG